MNCIFWIYFLHNNFFPMDWMTMLFLKIYFIYSYFIFINCIILLKNDFINVYFIHMHCISNLSTTIFYFFFVINPMQGGSLVIVLVLSLIWVTNNNTSTTTDMGVINIHHAMQHWMMYEVVYRPTYISFFQIWWAIHHPTQHSMLCSRVNIILPYMSR
jgi:hypothetical protein